jgi:hypothetical protein
MTPAQLDLLRTLAVRGAHTQSEKDALLEAWTSLCDVLRQADAVRLPSAIAGRT